MFWGKQNIPGAILGVPASNITAEAIDFRAQQGVYVLYAEYEMVYVGQVGNQELIARLRQHLRDDTAGRWDRFSWFGTRRVLDTNTLSFEKIGVNTDMATALNHLEAILIHSAEPKLNRRGGNWGGDATQYIQKRGPELGPTEQEMIKEIYDMRSEEG